MGTEKDFSGTNENLATQALVELTEANLPAGSHDEEWAEELAYLSGSATQVQISSSEVDEVIDLSTLLA